MTTSGGREAKVLFKLEKDADDYPPDDWESLWAKEVGNGGLYCIDNIPFFIRGISLGDIVLVQKLNKELRFDRIIEPSTHSVLRVILFEMENLAALKKQISSFGCEWEAAHIDGLIAIDVPGTVTIEAVLDYLKAGEDEGLWSYEEASLRHAF